MRILLGLAALAATVNAQTATVAYTSVAGEGQYASAPISGQIPRAIVDVRTGSSTGPVPTLNGGISPALTTGADSGGFIATNQFYFYIANTVSYVNFNFVTNTLTAQLQYRWSPDYPNPVTTYPNVAGLSATSYTCDNCASTGTGTPITCNSAVGPSANSANTPIDGKGWKCASLTRNYLFGPLRAAGFPATNPFVNSFSVQIFDLNQNPSPNQSSYSFQIIRNNPTVITGDPQIVGMQGQDFQVHGMPDEIFNIVTYPSIQVNARFTYLESAECHDNFTACFAHPGTYISEEGIRIGKDKIRIQAGTYKKGLSVSVNGKKTHSNVDLKHGAIEVVSHRRVIVHTEVMKISISNSDKFMNQELELSDDKLVTLGAKRTFLKDNQRFHPEVPLHGLQGQTWRNVEYPSGLEYEGSIMDYHVVDGNLFGTDFVFNQFQS